MSRQDRKSEIDAHFEVTTFSVGAALTAAVVTVAVMAWAEALQRATAAPWLMTMIALGAVHMGASVVYGRFPATQAHWRAWACLTLAITFLEGLGWGLAPFAIPQAGNLPALMLVMITTLCIATGSTIGAGRYFPTRIIAFVTPTAPYLIYGAFSTDRLVRGSVVLLALFLVALGYLGFAADRAFRREVSMRRRNALLALDLRRQKEIAERANVAKSTFLASASHDLRQPIHALGLYIGALRSAELAPPLRALADKMEASIAAMDRLFAALLDVSRLDASIVEVELETFPLDDLLAAVSEEFREAAHQKGLALTHEPGGLIVRTDRVLLERILRNLVSNAVRYTERGAVRVRSRRRGDKAFVQVWDSGRGIAKEHLPHIFEEYFQVGNAERDREKGLGLGLAIVRRLTGLIGSKVTMRSRVGRGSMFAVSVALGSARDLPAGARSSAATVEGARGLVVVVDDERAVRDAMGSALTGWGLSALAASSGEEALLELEARTTAPALLLCDYRLRAGEDGLAVVARFRERWGADLPAVLVTGDTAPERLAQAHAHRIHLLHKPVTYAKLRAAVNNLIGRSAPAEPAAEGLGPSGASS